MYNIFFFEDYFHTVFPAGRGYGCGYAGERSRNIIVMSSASAGFKFVGQVKVGRRLAVWESQLCCKYGR